MKIPTPIGLALISPPLRCVLLFLTITSYAGALAIPHPPASNFLKRASSSRALRAAEPSTPNQGGGGGQGDDDDPEARYGRDLWGNPYPYPELGTGPGQDDPLGAHDDSDEANTEEYENRSPDESDADDEEVDSKSEPPPAPPTPEPAGEKKGGYESSEEEDSDDEEEEGGNQGGSGSGQGGQGASNTKNPQ